VDQVRGANKACVYLLRGLKYCPNAKSRGIENALKKHSASGSGGSSSFSGKGNVLGSSGTPGSAGAASLANGLATNLDPQVKLLLGMLVVYFGVWYLFS
jgi:hypothetical protein